MEPTVLVEVIGIIALGILCLVSAISSWLTRRHLITVFGETPRPAQLSPRGYYLWLPEQAPPAAAPPGSSGARALAPAVEPGATSAPAPRPREEPELRGEHVPETTRKPGAAPSSRKPPAVPASTDLATLARDLDNADQAQADQAPERRVPLEGLPHKPPHFVRKATLVGNLPPSVAPPRMTAPVSTRPLPALTPSPVRAVQSSQSALAATVTVTARIVSANGGDNAEGAATVAHPDSLPTAAPDDFDDENEATKVMDLPTAEELALHKQRARGRATTLVSASAGVPSSARREPDVQVIGADTPWTPGDTSASIVAH
jgi:hypothetical protein